MESLKSITRRININFAFVQGSGWMSHCVFACYAAVYLSSKGISDTQTGITLSLAAVLSILLQTVLSDFSDRHPSVPLKRITSIITITLVCTASILCLVPASAAVIMILFIIGNSCTLSLNGFMNALMMQHNNIGLPVNFGVPRGVGSISYAVSSLILGMLVENISPDITMPLTIAVGLITTAVILLMPRPDRTAEKYHLAMLEPDRKPCSIAQMLRQNKVMVLLLIATAFTFIGQSVLTTFLIRAIEHVGGTTSDLGVCFLLSAGLELPTMLLSRPLLRKFGSKRLLMVSFLAFFLKSTALALAPSVGFIFASNIFCLFAMGLFGFSSVYFINSIVASDEKVRGQSLLSLCGSSGIGTVIGALIGGVIMDSLGITALLFICAGFSLMGLLCALGVSRLHTRQSRAKDLASPSVHNLASQDSAL